MQEKSLALHHSVNSDLICVALPPSLPLCGMGFRSRARGAEPGGARRGGRRGDGVGPGHYSGLWSAPRRAALSHHCRHSLLRCALRRSALSPQGRTQRRHIKRIDRSMMIVRGMHCVVLSNAPLCSAVLSHFDGYLTLPSPRTHAQWLIMNITA